MRHIIEAPTWWKKPRRISIVVDNPSWILPYGEELVHLARKSGDDAKLYSTHDEIPDGAIAFYFGCVKITPPKVLRRNRRNLIVHASNLPKGRGFSPLTWQILEGKNVIPVCLFEALEALDAGPIVYKTTLEFEGHELIDEMRKRLGRLHIELGQRFLDEPVPPAKTPQEGEESRYLRRHPIDSRLDPNATIAELFNQLRVVDNLRYPAFFELYGHRYRIRIDKMEEDPSKT